MSLHKAETHSDKGFQSFQVYVIMKKDTTDFGEKIKI
jgi:hypothetical protein